MSAKKKPIGSVNRLPPSGTDALRSPYKGHMSVKSNAFAATGCTRLTNQYGVMDHLNVHYKKIHTAKSRIDSGTPKSWTTSVKKADQMKRQGIKKASKTGSPSRPSSARPASKTSGGYRPHTAMSFDNKDLTLQDLELVDLLLDDSDDDAYRPRHTTKSHGSPSPGKHRTTKQNGGLNDTYGTTKSDWGNNNNTRTKGYTTLGLNTPRRSKSRLSETYQQRPQSTLSNDVLDQMADRFTMPQKEYTPRTLKTNAKSRLSQSKNYNPPKRKGKESTKPTRPPVEEDAYSEFSEEDIEFAHENEQQQHQRHTDENGEPHIPPSPDLDETNEHVAQWVTKHANSPQHRNGRPMNGSREFNNTLGDIQEGKMLNQSQNSFTYTGRTDRKTEMTPRRTSRKMEEQEEELRYLEFVTDVTNDVLNRGIYTNKVLKQVFETHIQLHKEQLEEARMRELMSQLQRDLQIPDSDDEEYDSDDER